MPGFSALDPDLFDLYDVVAHVYGVLPSEVAALSWSDLFLCVQCERARSERMKKVIRQNKRKKGMLFPNLSVSDMIDIL